MKSSAQDLWMQRPKNRAV